MPNWRIQTKNKIKELKKQGFYNNWLKKEFDLITFFIYSDFQINNEWFKKELIFTKKTQKY